MQEQEESHSDGHLTCLPIEVLEKILTDPVLDAIDLLSFSRTSSICAETIGLNSLWKTKFKQRWPVLARRVVKFFSQCDKTTQIKWKSIYKHRMMVRKAVLSHVVEIGRANYMEEDRYQLALNEVNAYNFAEAESVELAEAAGSDASLSHFFVMNELREATKRGPQWENMTRKFYADKCLHCLSHEDIRPEIEALLTSNSNNIDLEEGATLIAQWMQPQEEFSLADVKTQLDALTEDVKVELRTSCPSHPLFAADVSSSCLSPGDSQSLWSPHYCRAVLAAIEQLVKFRFNQSFADYAHPHKSYINCVLKNRQAIPITLCLILMGIARRLGVVLEPVSFPETFVLRWLEFPFKSGLERYTFIDPFNGRYNVSSTELPSRFADRTVEGEIDPRIISSMDRCSKQEVLLRMLRNLLNCWRQAMTHHEQRQTMLRHVVELECMAEPSNYHHVILMVQVLLQLEVNIQLAMVLIQELVAVHPALTTALSDIPLRCESMLSHLKDKVGKPRLEQPKRRADYPQVEHAVGLIMQHKKYSYRCVIAGWDSTCQASEQWIRQMGVDRLPKGRHQPFYHVWAADGTDRYAAQENLMIAPTPGPVVGYAYLRLRDTSVTKTGRLFDSYNGLFYVPNTYLVTDYPDDTQFCREKMTAYLQSKDQSTQAEWWKAVELLGIKPCLL